MGQVLNPLWTFCISSDCGEPCCLSGWAGGTSWELEHLGFAEFFKPQTICSVVQPCTFSSFFLVARAQKYGFKFWYVQESNFPLDACLKHFWWTYIDICDQGRFANCGSSIKHAHSSYLLSELLVYCKCKCASVSSTSVSEEWNTQYNSVMP